MLVLSRKEGERLSIGDDITIVVTKVAGNRVTIGIEAPRNVKIVRGELDTLEVKPAVCNALDNCESGSLEMRTFAKKITSRLRQVG